MFNFVLDTTICYAERGYSAAACACASFSAATAVKDSYGCCGSGGCCGVFVSERSQKSTTAAKNDDDVDDVNDVDDHDDVKGK